MGYHNHVYPMQDEKLTRINKYLSEVGYCSRRAADKLIEQGRVTINGQVPEMGTKIKVGDKVRVDGEPISNPKEKPVYLAFNKPVGIVCTTDTKVEKDNIVDFINYPTRIFPIGRLDKPSEGRFVIKSEKFHETTPYAADREIIVVGVVDGKIERKIGDKLLILPLIKATSIHLWPINYRGNYYEHCRSCYYRQLFW